MEGIGEILREARERKDVSFAEIEEAIKIKKRYLLALEHEEWSVLPGKVYAKGFLRTYARYLGLDERSLSDLYELSTATSGTERSDALSQTPGRKRKGRKKKKQPEVDLHNKPKKKMIYVLCVLSIAVLTFAVWAYKTYYLNEIEAEKTTPPPIVQPQPQPESETKPEIIEPEPEPVILTAFVIRLEATESCWLRLRDQKNLVYEGTMLPGEVREYEDIETIDIRIGNAGGLVMTLNGIKIPPLGTSGQVVAKYYSISEGKMVDDETGETLS